MPLVTTVCSLRVCKIISQAILLKGKLTPPDLDRTGGGSSLAHRTSSSTCAGELKSLWEDAHQVVITIDSMVVRYEYWDKENETEVLEWQ